MIDLNSPQNKARRRRLQNAYVKEPQFGFVLGAGVTCQSGVPTYIELALRLNELSKAFSMPLYRTCLDR
jgi:hypothetical protein